MMLIIRPALLVSSLSNVENKVAGRIPRLYSIAPGRRPFTP